MSRADFDRVADGEVRRAVELQVEAGVDIVVDGEQRRDNFVSFVSEKLDGTRLISLTDSADDEESFSEELAAADVPPDSIMNAVCVGKLKRRQPLAVDEYKFVRELTDRPIKVPLPGPYILIRSMWSPKFTRDAYAEPTDMADDIVGILRDELIGSVMQDAILSSSTSPCSRRSFSRRKPRRANLLAVHSCEAAWQPAVMRVTS